MVAINITREQIGRQIKGARVLMGWSQEEMAAELRTATSDESWTNVMVSKLETGRKKIDAELLAVIGDLCGRSIDWFYELAKIRVRNL